MVEQEKLHKAVRLVLYELQMLRGCARAPQFADQFFENLHTEGLVLHARVLRDFFFTKVDPKGQRIKQGDDIVAADYFTDASVWPYTSTHLPTYLRTNKDRMDRAVVHLSFARLDYLGEEKKWYPEPISREIGDKWFGFLRCLQDKGEPAASWFIQQAPKYGVPVEPPL